MYLIKIIILIIIILLIIIIFFVKILIQKRGIIMKYIKIKLSQAYRNKIIKHF